MRVSLFRIAIIWQKQSEAGEVYLSVPLPFRGVSLHSGGKTQDPLRLLCMGHRRRTHPKVKQRQQAGVRWDNRLQRWALVSECIASVRACLLVLRNSRVFKTGPQATDQGQKHKAVEKHHRLKLSTGSFKEPSNHPPVETSDWFNRGILYKNLCYCSLHNAGLGEKANVFEPVIHSAAVLGEFVYSAEPFLGSVNCCCLHSQSAPPAESSLFAQAWAVPHVELSMLYPKSSSNKKMLRGSKVPSN